MLVEAPSVITTDNGIDIVIADFTWVEEARISHLVESSKNCIRWRWGWICRLFSLDICQNFPLKSTTPSPRPVAFTLMIFD
jgi:hypothetical protein